MPDRPFLRLLQTIQERAQAQGRQAPIATRLLGMIGGPAQPQTPAPAPVQRPVTPAAPAASAGQRLGYDPQVEALQERMASLGLNPGPIDGIMGPRTMAAMQQMQRMEMAAPSSAPMQRPGGPVPVPLPVPNPQRTAADNYGFFPNYRPSGIPAPVMPVERAPIEPAGWRPAAGTPQGIRPGMAVPRGTSRSMGDQPVPAYGFDALVDQFPGVQFPGGVEGARTQIAMNQIGHDQPRYEGEGLYGYQGMGGIPRIEYGLGDMPGSMGALGRVNPAIIQALLAPPPSQGIDPGVLQQVIMQLQRGPGA